jgi:hypothetical protein
MFLQSDLRGCWCQASARLPLGPWLAADGQLLFDLGCAGGTSSRQAFATCDTVECLRQVGSKPAASADTSEGTTAAAAAGGGMEMGLSTTPTLLGIQPFGHVTSTPRCIPAAPSGDGKTAVLVLTN